MKVRRILNYADEPSSHPLQNLRSILPLEIPESLAMRCLGTAGLVLTPPLEVS